MNTNMKEEANEIFCSLFDLEPEDLNENLSPDQVPEWDSIGHMSLISGLESTFGVQLSTGEILEIQQLKDVYKVLERRLNNDR